MRIAGRVFFYGLVTRGRNVKEALSLARGLCWTRTLHALYGLWPGLTLHRPLAG